MKETYQLTETEFKAAQEETDAFLSKVFLVARAASQAAVECPEEIEE